MDLFLMVWVDKCDDYCSIRLSNIPLLKNVSKMFHFTKQFYVPLVYISEDYCYTLFHNPLISHLNNHNLT